MKQKSRLLEKRHIYISVLAVIVLGFLLTEDLLANLVWKKYGNVAVALLLVRRDAGLALQLGNHYYGGREYDLGRAETAYRKAVKADPKILWGHYQLARILFVKGNYDAALDEINKELAANPENLRSLYVRGLINGYRGNLLDAEDDFRRFTQWEPKEWAGYNDLAWILSSLGKNNDAKTSILAAFREVPAAEKNPWLWNSLGVAELNLRDYIGAIKSFQKAKELAEKLAPGDWHNAYPGNDPQGSGAGLAEFRRAIEENLRRSQSVDKPQ